jgi:hypothetical protein
MTSKEWLAVAVALTGVALLVPMLTFGTVIVGLLAAGAYLASGLMSAATASKQNQNGES